MRSCHVRYSMRPQYTLLHRIVAQIKSKYPNRTCSEALPGENSTCTNVSSPLTNGSPPRRWSRRGVILSLRPHTQILWFVPIKWLTLYCLLVISLIFRFRNFDGFGFLDVNHLLWYGFCCILVCWCVLIGFQSG